MRQRQLKKLYYGGRIYTVSDRLPVCDAMIVENDRISWLGSASGLSAVPSDSYELIDLGGKIVLPGFIDSHTHLVFWALSRQRVDLDGTHSYQEALTRIKDFLKNRALKKNDWLIGKGWKKEEWQKVVWPHKSDLDRVIPNNPAVIFSKDEHLLWVNSKALEVAEIGRDSVDHEGGAIDRDGRGEATGILKDTAMNMVYNLRKEATLTEKKTILAQSWDEVLKQGCVGVSSFDHIDNFEVLQSSDVAGNLPIKVTYYFPVEQLDEVIRVKLKSGYGSEFLKVGGIKIFADGALGSQTALMLELFKGSRTNTGFEVTSRRDLTKIIRSCSKSGLACAVHAIGDRANRNVLDAFEAAGGNFSKQFRCRVEHCQIVAPEDITRFSKLDLVASMQPSHATGDIDLMRLYLGDRKKDCYRFRSLSKLGTSLCFGSDAPIEALIPLKGIYAAVTGKRESDGICYNPGESLSIHQAVRGFTLGGAEAVGEGRIRGNLEVGKKADFIILDRDIMRLKPEQILATRIVATYINGELKYVEDNYIEK